MSILEFDKVSYQYPSEDFGSPSGWSPAPSTVSWG